MLTKQQIIEIRSKLKQSKLLDQCVKKFQFIQTQSHNQNIKKLIKILQQDIFGKNKLNGLLEYMSHDQNIPIEVNFKLLKTQHLKSIFEDWINHSQQQSLNIDRTYTTNIRNVLFKKILYQSKQTINQYFSSLSKESHPCLKGFDIYQLLQEIISSEYYLYENNCDSQTFFNKENSYDRFLKVVKQFQTYQKRIPIFKSSKKQLQSCQYIKQYQLQMFIQFWQNINPQLTLLDFKRHNLINNSSQTHNSTFVNKQTQTQKIFSQNLLDIINKTIYQMNILLQKQNGRKLLLSMERIYQCLMHEKIYLIKLLKQPEIKIIFQYTSHNTQINKFTKLESPRTPPPKAINQKQYSNRFKINNLRNGVAPSSFIKSKSRNRLLSKSKHPQSSSFRDKKYNLLTLIYDYYSKGVDYMDLDSLNKFFYELGMIEEAENYLIFNILQNKMIRNPNSITLDQFIRVVNTIMKEDQTLTENVLQIFYGTLENNYKLKRKDKSQNYKIILTKDHKGSLNTPNQYTIYQPRIQQTKKSIFEKQKKQMDQENSDQSFADRLHSRISFNTKNSFSFKTPKSITEPNEQLN